jgi:hypothetical protein
MITFIFNYFVTLRYKYSQQQLVLIYSQTIFFPQSEEPSEKPSIVNHN